MNQHRLRILNHESAADRTLYERYVEFLSNLGSGHRRGYAPRSFEDFSAWWRGLGTTQREILENNFRVGLDGTLMAGRREIEELLHSGKLT